MFCHGRESWDFISMNTILAWCENFDLPNVSISSTLLVLQYTNLDMHRFSCESVLVIEREHIPANWVFKLYLLNLLKLMETVCYPDRYFLRSVALISLTIKIKCYFLNSSFTQELDIDKMWLLTI